MLIMDSPKTKMWHDVDTALWKQIPTPSTDLVLYEELYPFPAQTDEIANEPTRKQLIQFRTSQMVQTVKTRAGQIWAGLEKASASLDTSPHTQRVQDFFDSAACWTAAMWRRYTYNGNFRGSGRGTNRALGRHHCVKNDPHEYNASTPVEERIYLGADDWARKLQTEINNAEIIRTGACGPLAKE